MQGKKGWFRPLAHHSLNPPLSMGRDPQFKGESFDFINSVVVYGPFFFKEMVIKVTDVYQSWLIATAVITVEPMFQWCYF